MRISEANKAGAVSENQPQSDCDRAQHQCCHSKQPRSGIAIEL
jgi:hypothetical protein